MSSNQNQYVMIEKMRITKKSTTQKKTKCSVAVPQKKLKWSMANQTKLKQQRNKCVVFGANHTLTTIGRRQNTD